MSAMAAEKARPTSDAWSTGILPRGDVGFEGLELAARARAVEREAERQGGEGARRRPRHPRVRPRHPVDVDEPRDGAWRPARERRQTFHQRGLERLHRSVERRT